MTVRVICEGKVMEGIPTYHRAHKVGEWYFLYRFQGKVWKPAGATKDKTEVKQFLEGAGR